MLTRNAEYIVNDGGKDVKYHFETNIEQVLTPDGNLKNTLNQYCLKSEIPEGSISNSSLTEWKPNYLFKKNSLLIHDNKLYLITEDFTSGEEFIYNKAYLYLLNSISLGSTIYLWEPNYNYQKNDFVYYQKRIYKVLLGFQSSNIFDASNLEEITLDHDDTQNINQIGTNYYHLNESKNNLINNLSDINSKLYYKDKQLGDMLVSFYDRNFDGVVDSAETLLGLNVSISELNSYALDINKIKEDISKIKNGIVLRGELPTYNDLLQVKDLFEGLSYIILKDETRDGNKTYYIYNQNNWYYMGVFDVKLRDFKIDKIDLSLEVTNILKEANIDSKIARKTELHSHSNMHLIKDYTNTNTQITEAINKSHLHFNIATLNKINEDGFGNMLFNGKPLSSSTSSISDLSNFSTDDLKDFQNKRYVTDYEKTNISKIQGINDTLNNTILNLNNLNGKLPSGLSSENPLITKNDAKALIGTLNILDLNGVDTLKNGELLMLDNGIIKSTKMIQNGISSLSDNKGNSFNNINSIKFNNATLTELNGIVNINKDNICSFELLDMPKENEYINNGFLVLDINTGKYKQKTIDEFTDKLQNKNYLIENWTPYETKFEAIIQHNLNSENIILNAYDENNYNLNINYKIIDSNSIKIISDAEKTIKVVINNSQGTISSIASRSSSTEIVITKDMFIDDERIKLDKTFSSEKINNLLNDYYKKSNVYSKFESDSRYSLKQNEHSHLNSAVLNDLRDIGGDLYFKNKKIISDFNPKTFCINRENEINENLTLVLNTTDIMMSENIKMINNSEILIKNNHIDQSVTLIIDDANINILNIQLSAGEVQKYILGISPNIKIYAKGSYSFNYTITGF